jgi:predicted unusual protein kinase regulating ubiquinone biosynthesis (AarF/ABC1/UbiB family)
MAEQATNDGGPDRGPLDRDESWALPGSRLTRRLHIYRTAAKVGSRYAAANRPLLSGAQRERLVARANRRGARDLYETAIHLRGSFLKLGQFVSARPDLLPPAYVEELSKLQDRVPPAPAGVIVRTIEKDVGPIDDLFAHFDAHSASAASLAQVHRATRADGREVAVKVQYPRVRELVPQEAKDTTRILNLVSHLVKGVDLPTIARALEHNVMSEIDYEHEADNIEEFARNFKDEPQIEIPGLHRDLSKGRVLVMDWIEGENLARALAHADHDVASEALRVLVDAFLKQILVDGFLHADPHPGNFLLQTDPLRIGMVDFGACARISDATRLALRELYRAGTEADFPAIGEALHQLGFRTQSGDIDGLVAFGSLFAFEDEDEVTREENWNRLITAAKDNPLVKIPDELIMVGRVLIVQTGMVSKVRPAWKMDDLVRARLESSS